MIKAIVRPEKSDYILEGLLEAGYPAVTKIPVFGRGKQRGLKVGEVHYDELSKEMLILVIPENDKDFVINTITERAKTGSGNYGDGKIFIQPVEEVYTISSGIKE
jgi:nitrogen regulatory protein PII 1